MNEVIAEVRGSAGLITLNRPKALNALSLGMIRELMAVLLAWREDPRVEFVAVRGQGREGPFGALCAGGDIRFFHAAVLAGDPRLEDFFTEEYELDHLVHTYPKPWAVFMDGIVMGGGMGISGHGRAGPTLRIATERTKMAMPETNIGLFPDVGGGWFLAHCPGHIGMYLALTGRMLDGDDAVYAGLADAVVPSSGLHALWDSLGAGAPTRLPHGERERTQSCWLAKHREAIDAFFGLAGVPEIVAALASEGSDFARETLAMLRQRSPLMLHVTFEQVRRAGPMSLADDLRMERGVMRRCFTLRPGTSGETMEGIRALAVDKDHSPRWSPARIEDVTPEMVQAFFDPPWPPHAHPLRALR